MANNVHEQINDVTSSVVANFDAWRFERKFAVEYSQRAQVEAWLMTHPAGFRKAFPNRWINNIYYDTLAMQCYAENVAGVNQRKKYRIRWYGERWNKIQNPTLEIKLKMNELGSKIHRPMTSFEVVNPPKIHELFNEVKLLGENLYPQLINRYYRSYFISADGQFRLTIDDQMQFLSADHRFASYPNWNKPDGMVIEIKYNKAADDQLSTITKHIPFRHTKNSKYVTGILLTH